MGRSRPYLSGSFAGVFFSHRITSFISKSDKLKHDSFYLHI